MGGFLGGILAIGGLDCIYYYYYDVVFLSSSKYKDNSEFDSKGDQVGGEDSIEQVE